MATRKITEVEAIESVKDAASVLITQLEENSDGDEVESLRRATIEALSTALRDAGILDEAAMSKGTISSSTKVAQILGINSWKAGWMWKITTDLAEGELYRGSPAVRSGDFFIATADHPDDPLLTSEDELAEIDGEVIESYFTILATREGLFDDVTGIDILTSDDDLAAVLEANEWNVGSAWLTTAALADDSGVTFPKGALIIATEASGDAALTTYTEFNNVTVTISPNTNVHVIYDDDGMGQFYGAYLSKGNWRKGDIFFVYSAIKASSDYPVSIGVGKTEIVPGCLLKATSDGREWSAILEDVSEYVEGVSPYVVDYFSIIDYMPEASTEYHGLMSADDKAKLDGIVAKVITVEEAGTIEETLAETEGSETTDYFVLYNGVYYHYRYIDDKFIAIDNGAVNTAEEVEAARTFSSNTYGTLSDAIAAAYSSAYNRTVYLEFDNFEQFYNGVLVDGSFSKGNHYVILSEFTLPNSEYGIRWEGTEEYTFRPGMIITASADADYTVLETENSPFEMYKYFGYGTFLNEATTNTAGLMSAEDKAKLDSFAGVTVISSLEELTEIVEANDWTAGSAWLIAEDIYNELDEYYSPEDVVLVAKDTLLVAGSDAGTAYESAAAFVAAVTSLSTSGNVYVIQNGMQDLYDNYLEDGNWRKGDIFLLHSALVASDDYPVTIGVGIGQLAPGRLLKATTDGLPWKTVNSSIAPYLISCFDTLSYIPDASTEYHGLMSAEDKAKLDETSKTYLLTELPETGEDDADYIVYDGKTCLYYRYIDEEWVMIGGSAAEFVTVEDGSTIEDTLAEIEGSETTDYFVRNSTSCYHYRYIITTDDDGNSVGEWTPIGGSEEIAASISSLETRMSNAESSISTLSEDVTSYGNDISDIKDDLNNLQDDVAANAHTYDIGYDEETSTLSLYEDESTDAKTSFVISGGGGTSAGSTVTITKITTTPVTVLYGSDYTIEYSFSSVDSSGDETGDCTAYWYVSNVLVATETVAQGDCSFEVGSYLASGSNNVRLRIVDPNGAAATSTWVVRTVNMYLTSTFDDKTVYSGDVTVRFTPYGSGISKTVYVYLDGELYFSSSYTSSGVAQTLTIPASDLGHGTHPMSIYCEATVNDTLITSDTLYFDLLFVGDETTAVIGCAYDGSSIMQYSSVTLNYYVYSPTSQTSSVNISVYDVAEDDTKTLESSSNVTVDRTTQVFAYKPTTYGSRLIVFTCGTATKEIELTVEEFPYDVSEVSGKAFDFNPTGRSNSDEGYTNYENNGYKMSVSDNFDWTNGGWKTDDDGNSYFCVKAGDRMYLDYPLFYDAGDEKDIKQTGMNFKFIYKATACRDFAAKVMECLSDNIGTSMTASAASFFTGSSAAVAEMPYAEDTYMELEWNVTPDENSSGFAEIFGLIDGDYTQGRVYTSTETFMQQTQAPITFGSDDCDVWIYRFKAYRTSLTDTEIITNRIADAPDATEMAERYTRCDLLDDDGELSYTKIQSVLPDLRVVMVECPAFTTGKDNKVNGCTVTHILPSGGSAHSWTATGVMIKGQGTSSNAYGASGRNIDIKCSDGFTFTDGTKADTYSMTDNSIGVNYFNIKVNVASSENSNNACLADDFNTFQPYIRAARLANSKVRDTMEFHPCVIFVKETHVDSDGNAVSPIEFDDENWHFYACGDFGNSKKNHEVFGMDTTNPYECIVEISNNTDKICLFKHDGTSFNDDGSANFDIIFDYEGWGDATDAQMEAGWHNSLEFRYPEDFGLTDSDGVEWSAADHKALLQEAFMRFYKWVASTDTEAATNVALSESVTYDGVTYTTDSAEYRRAKFIAEFENYMEKDSVLYHYLFTERHTMVDNRAKNTFWHTEDGLIWDLCFDYDNDTASGNNNEGDLTLTFGLEDIDQIGDANVFNGATSTLWVNVRANFYDDLAALYKSLESQSTSPWSAERYLEKVTEYQWVKSERLQMFDMRRKYIRPYEEPNTLQYSQTTTYLKMMYGRKTHQRAQFETYQEQYTSSKYGGTVARSDSNAAQFRSNSGGVLTIVPYAAIYVAAMAGSTAISKRAQRGDVITIDFSALELNDTETYIYSAKLVQEIDGLASFNISWGDFSPAVKLKKLIIGSSEDGYENTMPFSELSVKSNDLLEILDLRNCSNFTAALDLSNCAAMKELYTTGTQCSGVTFATGGMIETAQLNDIGALVMKNLTHLYYGRSDTDDTLTFESTDALSTLTVENSDSVYAASQEANADTACINVPALLEACENVTRTRLTKMYWMLDSSTLLDRIYAMTGLDASGYSVSRAVLTGYVYLTMLYQSDRDKYEAVWGTDDLTIKCGTEIAQYKSEFYSDFDDEGNPTGLLCTHYIDQGGDDYAPVNAGEITSAPTKDSTDEYDYTFANWYCVTDGVTYEDSADAKWATYVLKARVYVAQYTETKRSYTVTFVNDKTNKTIYSETVEYGNEVVYDYDTYGYPKYTDGIDSAQFYLFRGWDRSTACVTCDMEVNPLWDTLFNTSPIDEYGEDTLDWDLVGLYAAAAGFSDKLSTSTAEGGMGFSGGERFRFKMGNDVSFNEIDSDEAGYVEQYEIVVDDAFVNEVDDAGEPLESYFGNTDSYEVKDADGNPIALFAEDAPSFTLAIDVEMNGKPAGTDTDTVCPILSCGNLKLGQYLNTSTYYYPVVDWGNTQQTFPFDTQREMIVLRHKAGEDELYVYVFDNQAFSKGFSDAITTYTLTGTSGGYSDDTLCLGGGATGFIHWCKLWYDDLGDGVARQLAAWTRETWQIALASNSDTTFNKYVLASDSTGSTYYAPMSFQVLNPFSRVRQMNSTATNVGGWHECAMRDFLNPSYSDYNSSKDIEYGTGDEGIGRVWYGMPVSLRAMIQKVQIYTGIGGEDNRTLKISYDYLYLASYQENNSANSNELYYYEGSYYNVFLCAGTNKFKVRFPGLVIPEDAIYYSDSVTGLTSVEVALTDATVDPTSETNKHITVKEGDIWINSSTGYGYYYVTSDTYTKYGLSLNYYSQAEDYVIAAEDGSGYWLKACYWWERSPYISDSNRFLTVHSSGVANFTALATAMHCVCPCFSIGSE